MRETSRKRRKDPKTAAKIKKLAMKSYYKIARENPGMHAAKRKDYLDRMRRERPEVYEKHRQRRNAYMRVYMRNYLTRKKRDEYNARNRKMRYSSFKTSRMPR